MAEPVLPGAKQHFRYEPENKGTLCLVVQAIKQRVLLPLHRNHTNKIRRAFKRLGSDSAERLELGLPVRIGRLAGAGISAAHIVFIVIR